MNEKVKYSYLPADTSFLINFGSRRLRPVRISLPKPPPIHLIAGYGLNPEQQKFRRLKIPARLQALEQATYEAFKGKKPTFYDYYSHFWDTLRGSWKYYEEEIKWMQKFMWHMHYGYWFFNNGKPTYITGWHFSYLHLHYMTLSKGAGYPEYRDKTRLRFLFRKYTMEATETFEDYDASGRAVKVNGKYRMKDVGRRVFVGTIEPKGRREGLTNEFCHINTRIMAETRGHDNLGTIVSMDGDNAETHFKKKLLPAFKRWPLWLKPIWKGGLTDIIFDVPKYETDPNIKVLGSSLNYTDSGGDLANDGKKIMAAGFDEQGKGKRVGDVNNRWQINREAMTLGAGTNIVGWCMHPSTVEKMEEGGQDYRELCDMSDFYTRGADGGTLSGLALCYMPSSYCMEGYIGPFGEAVLDTPTPTQVKLGYDKKIGSRRYVHLRRAALFDLNDPRKMDDYRSFVRKFPEDYDDCWRGVSGSLGLNVEKISDRYEEVTANPETVMGRFEWVNGVRFGSVEFEEDPDGPWEVGLKMDAAEANLKSSIEYYNSLIDGFEPMFRPLVANRFILGLDPHEFTNKAESVHLKSKFTKLSDLGMTVFQLRRKEIDTDDDNELSWVTRKAVANLQRRYANNEKAAEEALKAAIYYGAMIYLERNKSEVWSNIVKWQYGGYLLHNTEVLPSGKIQIDPKPGCYSLTQSKKKMFSLLQDQIDKHVHIENMRNILSQAKSITSMEEMTKFDSLTSYLLCLLGAESKYGDLIMMYSNEAEVEVMGIEGFNY